MAQGLLWHFGAFAFSVWLAYLFLKRKSRLEEIEGGVVTLLAWPVEFWPVPVALVRRVLRFCEQECADVLGTAVSLRAPQPEEAREAVAALVNTFRVVRSGAEAAAGSVEPSFAERVESLRRGGTLAWREGGWHAETRSSP